MSRVRLVDLTAAGALQKRLEEVVRGRRHRNVKVGLSCGGRTATAAICDSGDSAESAPVSRGVRVGCLTKLFTSALTLGFVRRGELRLDDDAGERLGASCAAAASQLRGITVAHLLEHAHGLDDSALGHAPLREDGRIDIALLVATPGAAARLCAPGELYSYSHIGPLFLAAVLEQISCRSWYALLQEQLFTLPASRPLRLCPSRGYDLAVPLETMLEFAEEQASKMVHEGVPMMRLPGWHSTETGIRCGWKCYDGGWIGHNSEPPAAAAALRVHPEERIAIVVEAGGEATAPILAAMFGRLLPELVNLRIPSFLDASACLNLDAGRYVGQYENETVRVGITRSKDAALELHAWRRRAGIVEEGPFLVTPLRAAQDGIFYPLPVHARLAPFVQFTGDTGSRFRFLWNGRSVWRNVDVLQPVAAAFQ